MSVYKGDREKKETETKIEERLDRASESKEGKYWSKRREKKLPESDISSQYGESNSYSALRICSNSLESFSS